MKKVEERRMVIQQYIEELEALHPRLQATGENPSRFAYSKSRARLKITGDVCLIAACGMVFSRGNLGVIITIELLLLAIFVVAYHLTKVGEYTYVIASKSTVNELSRILTSRKTQVEEFEQKKRDADLYQRKFANLYSVITVELNGTYKPHRQIERQFKIKIGFGEYKAEWYNLNEKGYGKLIYRIIASRHENGAEDDQFTDFIQRFESSL